MFQTLKPILISSCSFLFLVSQAQAQNPFEGCMTLKDVDTVYKAHVVPLTQRVEELDQTSHEAPDARVRIQTDLARAIEERNEASKYFVQAIQKANGLMEDDRGVSVRIKRIEIDQKHYHFATKAECLRTEASAGARSGSLRPEEVQGKLADAEINEEIARFWGMVSQNLKAEKPFKDHPDLEKKFVPVRSWRPQTVSLTSVSWQPFYIAKDPWELEGFVLPRERAVWEELLVPAKGIIKNILLKAPARTADMSPATAGDDLPLDVTERIVSAYGASNIIAPISAPERGETGAEERPDSPVIPASPREDEGERGSPRGVPQEETEALSASVAAVEVRRGDAPASPFSSGVGLSALVVTAPTEGTAQSTAVAKATPVVQTAKQQRKKR